MEFKNTGAPRLHTDDFKALMTGVTVTFVHAKDLQQKNGVLHVAASEDQRKRVAVMVLRVEQMTEHSSRYTVQELEAYNAARAKPQVNMLESEPVLAEA